MFQSSVLLHPWYYTNNLCMLLVYLCDEIQDIVHYDAATFNYPIGSRLCAWIYLDFHPRI